VTTKNGLARLGEVLGFIGVMGSLIFVGLEVRQSAVATRAATDASISDAFREINQVMASSPELALAMTSHPEDPDSLSPAEQVQVLGLWRSIFHTWSNAHRQHLNGTIDPAIFQSIVQEISLYSESLPNGDTRADLVRRGIFMRWAWSMERMIFNPEFAVFVDSILRPKG